MAYADLNFYESEYLCGREAVIATASFDFYAKQATQIIDHYTYGNIKEQTESIKMCCCEIAEIFFNAEKIRNQSNGKNSESIGGWSVSYADNLQTEQTTGKQIKNIIYKWLSGTGLLYAGVIK